MELTNKQLAAIYIAARDKSSAHPEDKDLRMGVIAMSHEIQTRCRKNQSVHEWLKKEGQ